HPGQSWRGAVRHPPRRADRAAGPCPCSPRQLRRGARAERNTARQRGLWKHRAVTELTDSELERYARQIVLPQIGGVGQRRLKAAKVAVIGAGGIGSAAIPLLAAAGVGRLTIIDDDLVDRSNL